MTDQKSAELYRQKANKYEALYEETGLEEYKRLAEQLQYHTEVLENGLEDYLNKTDTVQ